MISAVVWPVAPYLGWIALCTTLCPGGALSAQATTPRRLAVSLTGCDSSQAARPDTVYLADQVDREVRPSRLTLPKMPLRLGHVLRGRSVLRFIVEPSGRIERCSLQLVEEASTEWTDSIVKQLRSTRYEPARRRGRQVAQWVEQLFLFQNDGRD